MMRLLGLFDRHPWLGMLATAAVIAVVGLSWRWLSQSDPGEGCSEHEDCRSSRCLETSEGRICSVPCTSNADCPGQLFCGDAAVTSTLVHNGIPMFSQSETTGARFCMPIDDADPE